MRKLLLLFVVLTLTTLTAQAQQVGARSLSQGKPVIVTDPANCPDPIRFTLNQDLYGLDNRFNRLLIELGTSVSSEVQTIMPPDRARLDAYIQAMENYRSWVTGQNFMDYPGTYKLYYCLTELVEPVYVPSEQIRDIMNQTLVMKGEMTLSQSSRLTTGLLPADDARLGSYLDRMRKYLTVYADAEPPADYPRSTTMTRLIEGTEPR